MRLIYLGDRESPQHILKLKKESQEKWGRQDDNFLRYGAGDKNLESKAPLLKVCSSILLSTSIPPVT